MNKFVGLSAHGKGQSSLGDEIQGPSTQRHYGGHAS